MDEPTKAKRTTVRANSAQTAILKDAFVQSNIVSPAELKTLSEKTGLPEKWINLWFGRQRVKARKTTINLGHATSTSDPVPSPQEILEVKMEYRDSLVPRSSSPAVPVASIIGLTSDGDVGQPENAPQKKKARVSQPRAQKAKKKQTTIRQSLVKAEYMDPVVNPLGNSAFALPSMAQNSISCENSHPPRLNEGPPVAHLAFPLPRIAPPSRTPLTSANISAHPGQGEDRRSGLSTNQSYRIHPPLRTSDVTTVNVADPQPPIGVFKPSKAVAVYQQGPRFNTQFYNNGPANYRHTVPNVGTIPSVRSDYIPLFNQGSYLAESMLSMSDVSGRQKIPERVGLEEYFYQPLAPAFILENTSKSTPSFVAPLNDYSAHTSGSSAQCIGSSTIMDGMSSYEESDINAGPEDIDIFTQSNLFVSRMQASQPFPSFYNGVLDPSLAPLKHLTDILGGFRDQDGTYKKLVDLKEREGLINCLLDDELARRNPFQAAMGLVLLSKLGLEWDY